MSTTLQRHTIWISRPTAAAAASLVTVLLFIGLLGVVFLPREARRLFARHYVSVTHYLPADSGRPALSLFWSIDQTGVPGWHHHVVLHDADRLAPQFPCSGLRPLSIARGPEANQVLVGSWDGTIYSLDLGQRGAAPQCIGRQEDGGVIALASSSDGQCVLSQSAFSLHGWDVSSSAELWRRDDVMPYCFVIRPDASTALCGTLAGDVMEIDLHSGRDVRTLLHQEQPICSLAISRDGGHLALQRAAGALRLIDAHTGDELWPDAPIAPWHAPSGRFAAFSPCSRFLVTADPHDGSMLVVWSVASGRRLAELRGHTRAIHGASFAESGSLYSWAADGTVRTWDLRTGITRQITALAPPPLPS